MLSQASCSVCFLCPKSPSPHSSLAINHPFFATQFSVSPVPEGLPWASRLMWVPHLCLLHHSAYDIIIEILFQGSMSPMRQWLSPFFSPTAPCSLWDHSSPTRDRTQAPQWRHLWHSMCSMSICTKTEETQLYQITVQMSTSCQKQVTFPETAAWKTCGILLVAGKMVHLTYDSWKNGIKQSWILLSFKVWRTLPSSGGLHSCWSFVVLNGGAKAAPTRSRMDGPFLWIRQICNMHFHLRWLVNWENKGVSISVVTKSYKGGWLLIG